MNSQHVNGHPASSDKQQLLNGGDSSAPTIVITSSGDPKYTIAGQHILQSHEIYVKSEPGDPMPPLASPAIDSSVNNSSQQHHSDQQQLYFISSELVPQMNKSNNSHSSSPESKDDNRQINSEQVNGNHSPSDKNLRQQLVVTNGDTTIITTSEAKEYSISHNNNQSSAVLQPHEIYIKAEPLDPMPPLASPATGLDTVSTSTASVSSGDKMRDMDASPPATVISLAPAQPYPRATTQLTFAAPAYDLSGTGQYTVQVNPGVSPPQYATVTQTAPGQNNAQTVYLTTDYITYRDYYTTPTSSDQYQTVRQQLNTTPAVTYTQATNDQQQPSSDSGSFLDRYLRQAPITTQNGTTYKSTIHGGLTVDLPSPDSGIGEATITPRTENGAIAQVKTESIA